MILHKDGINNFLWDTLMRFQNDPFFKNYHLAGGTAFSLQIGHRISEDIDLFTKDDLQKEHILQFAQNIHKNVEVRNEGNTIYQLYFPHQQLKVDFVHYPHKLLDPVIETDEGLHMIGINDIAAMKMSAAGTRGYEAKDFVDLFFILKKMQIDTIIENFIKKYESENPLHYIRSMAYFDDVSPASWQAIKMIHEPLSVNDIKNTLINEVRDYERRMLNNVRD